MDDCGCCGLAYADFRTGFTYKDIYQMLWSPDEDSSTWVYKRRNTILGKWHEIKVALWEQHVDECREQAEYYAAQ